MKPGGTAGLTACPDIVITQCRGGLFAFLTEQSPPDTERRRNHKKTNKILAVLLSVILCAALLGAFVAIVNLSRSKALSAFASVYVNVLRGTPLLVQMYISYYFIPMVVPALNDIDKIYYVMLALTLNSSAYVAEIIRSGIGSVDSGQAEATRSLGLSRGQTMTRIILPQAVKNILPALGNEYIAMIKETSLAGTFMLYELMYTRTILANKYLVWQPQLIIAGIYLAVTLLLSAGVKKKEKRLSVSD